MDLSAINGVVLIPLVLLALIIFDWVITTDLDDLRDPEDEQK